MTHLTAKTQTQQGATSFISIIVFFKQRAMCINLYKNDLLLTWSKTKRQLINIVERENCFILHRDKRLGSNIESKSLHI